MMRRCVKWVKTNLNRQTSWDLGPPVIIIMQEEIIDEWIRECRNFSFLYIISIAVFIFESNWEVLCSLIGV